MHGPDRERSFTITITEADLMESPMTVIQEINQQWDIILQVNIEDKIEVYSITTTPRAVHLDIIGPNWTMAPYLAKRLEQSHHRPMIISYAWTQIELEWKRKAREAGSDYVFKTLRWYLQGIDSQAQWTVVDNQGFHKKFLWAIVQESRNEAEVIEHFRRYFSVYFDYTHTSWTTDKVEIKLGTLMTQDSKRWVVIVQKTNFLLGFLRECQKNLIATIFAEWLWIVYRINTSDPAFSREIILLPTPEEIAILKDINHPLYTKTLNSIVDAHRNLFFMEQLRWDFQRKISTEQKLAETLKATP